MKQRQILLGRLDALAEEFSPHCPFATSVLHVLIGAMETGIDREMAAVSLAWIKDELCVTAEMIGEIRDRRANPAVSPSDN